MVTKGDWNCTESAFARFTTFRGKRTGARTFVTTGIELDQIAEVQGDTEEEAEANANLIVSAVRACKEINPDNPQAVAESIGDMCEALKAITAQFERLDNLYSKDLDVIEKAEQALCKSERGL